MTAPSCARRTLLLLLFLVAAAFIGAETRGSLSFSPAAWEIGDIILGTRSRLAATVTNNATTAAGVSFLPTCGCLTVEPANQVIMPGASAAFTISYDSKDAVRAGRAVLADRKSFIVRSDLPGETAPYYYMLTAAVHSAASDVAAMRPWRRGEGRDAVLTLSYWYSPDCASCGDLVTNVIPALEGELGIRIEMLLKNPGIPLLEEELTRLLPQRSKYIPTYPVLKAGDAMLQGDAEIRQRLKDVLKAAVGPR